MKRIRIIFIIFIVLLTGCGVSTAPQEQNNPAETPQPTESTPTPKASQAPAESPKTDESTPLPTEQPEAAPPAPKAESGAVLGEFMTTLYDKQEGRLHNISLAISKLDGVTLQPGEEFSFNTIVGPRTKENGYQKAIIFEKSHKKKGYGGGVCQVSTTIFNAAKDAGMKITEQHEHKLDVPYIQKGLDASVAYGELDFRFVNTSNVPVRLGVSMTQSYIIAQLTAV